MSDKDEIIRELKALTKGKIERRVINPDNVVFLNQDIKRKKELKQWEKEVREMQKRIDELKRRMF